MSRIRTLVDQVSESLVSSIGVGAGTGLGARLSTMAAEMSLRREISHARGHKRKMKAEEEDTPEGLRHLKKPEPQFKWKKERKR